MTETIAPLASPSQRPHKRLGAYSRRLHRGALGNLFDGRSAEGRFVRNLEAELVAHCGGNPSITERLLIDRLIKIRLQLDMLDERLAAGNWTPHDVRTHGGLLNAYRLTAKAIGLHRAAAGPPSLAEALAAGRGSAA